MYIVLFRKIDSAATFEFEFEFEFEVAISSGLKVTSQTMKICRSQQPELMVARVSSSLYRCNEQVITTHAVVP